MKSVGSDKHHMDWWSRVRRRLGKADPLPDGGVVSSGTDEGGVEPAEDGAEQTAGGPPGAAPADEAADDDLNVEDDVLLDAVGSPVFMLDPAGEVVQWNEGVATLTGTSREEALGSDQPSELFYQDGRRTETLAEKVLAAPERADEVYDVRRAGPTEYTDSSTMLNADGEERHIMFKAQPLYEDDELVAVVETVVDRTDEARRRETTEELVTELEQTLIDITNGAFDSRAVFTGDRDVIDDELLEVIGAVNEMAETFEGTVGAVESKTDELDDTVRETNAAASEIASTVEEQTELLGEGVSEMQTFSASMEEVAATAEQVDGAAREARAAATEGVSASEDARTATDEVTEIGEELVASVATLGDRMDEIEDVVGVISDVAEQTNLLALNANIEAARAGEEGDGFAVVAEEVKSLADETRQHTEEITERIDRLQAETDDTVSAAEESREQIDHAADQIDDVLTAFEEIAGSIDEVADGIGEVSRATDDQAATVEELTATIEEAQDRSRRAKAATQEIVAATERGEEAIDELGGRVAELRGDSR